MTDYLAGAEPFAFEGDDRGVLVLHGFTGSTQSMRYLGEELNRRFGFSVEGPCLAGHGTSPDDMEKTGYLDWLGTVEAALKRLAARKRKVFVTGLSMGGTLTLNLAARFPDLVAGIAPINGAAGILGPDLAALITNPDAPARIPGIGSDIKAPGVTELAYAEVPVACVKHIYVLIGATADLLPKITCPALIVQSHEDHVVPAANARRIAERIASADTRLLWLDNSYHVATLDNDKDLIVDRVGGFFTELS